MKKISIHETAAWLRERDRFVLITHDRPDGDTLCSAAALAAGLRKIGKTAYVLPNHQAGDHLLQYMSCYLAPEDFVPKHVITVDAAGEGMLTGNAAAYCGRVALCIDHHPSNTLFAENVCLDVDAAACGEIVYRILLELCGGIDAEIAKLLYVAISTDTGCFAYANTTYETLATAAALVKAGAPNAAINKALFRTKSRSRIHLEGLIMGSLAFYHDGATAVSTITRKMLEETGATENELDDIASIPGQVRGVLVGVTIKEIGEEKCRVSLRTLQGVNANEICAEFGGGGHAMAAGCTICASPEEARRQLIRVIGERL